MNGTNTNTNPNITANSATPESIAAALQAQGWSPDEIRVIMEIAALQAESEGLVGAISSAEQMQMAEGPSGYYTGRAYIAADPLQHAAHAIQGIRGSYEKNKAQRRQEQLRQEILNRRIKALGKVMNPTTVSSPAVATTVVPHPVAPPASAVTAPYQPVQAMPPKYWTPIP